MPTIDDFLQRLRGCADGALVSSNVTDADVQIAEATLGVRLPNSYRTLVTSCIAEELPHCIYWLGRDLPPGLDLLNINTSAPIPSFLIAICGDGGGDEFCLDTRHPATTGEYPVVRWEHEIHDEQSSDFERVAPDLGTFLLQLL